MVNAREFYSKFGVGVCVIRDGKILETYLLGEDEIQKIEKISSVITTFPKDFDTGVIDFGENIRFGVFRVGETFLVFPVRTDNIAEIVRKREVIDAT
ncbi:MAG: hypothetical protein HA489_05415 [Archaeoglobales archaeon]|jgi:hypothetical protein|nr:hypothetical protein [Archaeoglobales archaeon]TDA27994.1 MAG: hypothetical protein DSO00_06165 [Archaeoglobi archaeon]